MAVESKVTRNKKRPIRKDWAFCSRIGIMHICRDQDGDGFARLRASHGGCDSPPDTRQEPPFEFYVLPHQTKNQTFRSGLFGGGGRIRTIEAIRSRFTVCPLWPLGNSPIFYLCEMRHGAGRRTRTPDLLITNQLLYRLSYTGVSNRTRLL